MLCCHRYRCDRVDRFEETPAIVGIQQPDKDLQILEGVVLAFFRGTIQPQILKTE